MDGEEQIVKLELIVVFDAKQKPNEFMRIQPRPFRNSRTDSGRRRWRDQCRDHLYVVKGWPVPLWNYDVRRKNQDTALTTRHRDINREYTDQVDRYAHRFFR